MHPSRRRPSRRRRLGHFARPPEHGNRKRSIRKPRASARTQPAASISNARQANQSARRNLVVLHEDNHCLAVLKPAGMLTMGDRTGDLTMVDLARQYIKAKYRKPGNVYLGVVHRLDRPVSGVLLFARTSKSAARLSEQFRTGRIEKVYHAWVSGVPREAAGEWTDYLKKDSMANVVHRTVERSAGSQRAVLRYRIVRQVGEQSLLEIRPATGRSHQIRAQLAVRQLPIVGDVKYGGATLSRGKGTILLHAASIRFQHPAQERIITIDAPAPADWPH